MTYQEALTWLYAQTRMGRERGPERARGLLSALEHPERQFDAIHVVGTNGKGSVCAMLDAGLHSSGLQVGRFTSPHLVDFRERIVVDGLEVPEAEVIRFVTWAQSQATGPAFFDLAVAMGFQHFAHEQVDLAVVEAGVGGKNDATITLERVRLVVITNVDFDHVETIGPTLRDIALEKAGAIRAGTPVVTAAQGEALEVIRSVALERNAALHVLEPNNPLFTLPKPPAMVGAHQLENAALTVASLRLLGFAESNVQAALEAHWPGRLETFWLNGRKFTLDGAHNPAGARALAQSLEPGYTLVFGAFSRKRVREILEPLRSGAVSLSFVSPGELGANPHALALEFGGQGFESLHAALEHALEKARPIVVAGSLYLVGQARTWLLEHGATKKRVEQGLESS